MILTGPEIRKQVKLGGEWDGKERTFEVPPPRRGSLVHCTRTIVDKRMNYIDIDPYDPELVGPNSIDLRLGDSLLVYECTVRRTEDYDEVDSLKERGWNQQNPVYPRNLCPLDMRAPNKTFELTIPEEGIVLQPGILYLGRTVETMGSNSFVPIVEGRSSVGRLGIHVHVTAGFCDLGFRGTITLEIHVIHPVRIYPNIPICQAYFLRPEGEIELYKGRYQNQVEPTASRFGMKVENRDE